MLDVLTCDVPRLAATLRTGAFRQSGIRVSTAGSVGEFVTAALRLAPDVVILEAGVVGPRAERAMARHLRARLPTVIHLHGALDETSSLDAIRTHVAEAATFDLRPVSGVNSAGVLRWIEFLRCPHWPIPQG